MSCNALQQTPRLATRPKAECKCHNSHALQHLYRSKSPRGPARGNRHSHLTGLSRFGDVLRRNRTENPRPACAATCRRSLSCTQYCHTNTEAIEQPTPQQACDALLLPGACASFLATLGTSFLILATPCTAAELPQVSPAAARAKASQ